MAQTYYLYNGYSTFNLALDPLSTGFGLRALQSSDVPLAFTFTPIASTSFVKICTTITAKSYCLDVYGNNKYAAHLADADNVSGQQWTIIPSQSSFKLSNQYTGQGWFLDVYSDTKGAFMSDKDYSGQYWKREEINPVPVSSTPRPATPSTSTVSLASGGPAEASNTLQPILPPQSSPTGDSFPSRAPTSSPVLSTGAKAGIGAGCALLAIVFAILIFSILYWRKKARNTPPSHPAPTATTTPLHHRHNSHGDGPKEPDTATAELHSQHIKATTENISPFGHPSMGELPSPLATTTIQNSMWQRNAGELPAYSEAHELSGSNVQYLPR